MPVDMFTPAILSALRLNDEARLLAVPFTHASDALVAEYDDLVNRVAVEMTYKQVCDSATEAQRRELPDRLVYNLAGRVARQSLVGHG